MRRVFRSYATSSYKFDGAQHTTPVLFSSSHQRFGFYDLVTTVTKFQMQNTSFKLSMYIRTSVNISITKVNSLFAVVRAEHAADQGIVFDHFFCLK